MFLTSIRSGFIIFFMTDRAPQIIRTRFWLVLAVSFIILFPLFPADFRALSRLPVRTGADLLLKKHEDLIRGKRIGLITNQTALLSDGIHLADALAQDKDVKLMALFAPEHGIRGDAPDMMDIQQGKDPKTGIPVYSLFGEITKPTAEMLKGIDILVFDIQDVGARFYTFISTLFLTMEVAAENNLPFIVLDRPNPIRGLSVEGPVREEPLKSFVAWPPIPIAHGMTMGELAMMANGEGWLKDGEKADLRVIKMEGWDRSLWYDETGLRWTQPSPSMLTLNTAVVYPGACLIEGTNVSEGRGSSRPFEYVGAPWIEPDKLTAALNRMKLPGVTFEPETFTPKNVSRLTTDLKFDGEICRGVFINVRNRDIFEPVKTGVAVLSALYRLFPQDFKFRADRLDGLAGTGRVREMILQGKPVDEIAASWKKEVDLFKNRRRKYLLY